MLARAQVNWRCLGALGFNMSAIHDMKPAVDCLTEALSMTAAGDQPELQAYPLWALGIAHWQQGDQNTAVTALERGLNLTRYHDPAATAWCLQILAWISADRGDAERSATLLGSAEHIWRGLGQSALPFPDLEKYQRRCEKTVTTALSAKGFAKARDSGAAMTREDAVAYALNQRPAHTIESTGESEQLTKREWEVAALVAQGLTNKAIAEALVVSHRTAQGHVENILTKLGFNSRSQIAAWMASRQASA